MILLSLSMATAAAAQVPALAPPAFDAAVCDNKPVIMLVSGEIRDWARIRAYGAAIRDSGLYDRLGGYYLNVPRPLAVFEGTPPPMQSILMVRFPCLAHARTFWFSKEYQETLKPLRLDPNGGSETAGEFVVTVYPEAAVPEGVKDWWPATGALKTAGPGIAAAVPQIEEKAP